MFEHMSRNRLPAIHPFLRYAPYSCVHYNYATDHRAGGVAISQPAYCCPQRVLVIFQMTGGAPEGQRNGVLRCDQGTVSENRDCGANWGTVWQVDGPLDSATHVARGDFFGEPAARGPRQRVLVDCFYAAMRAPLPAPLQLLQRQLPGDSASSRQIVRPAQPPCPGRRQNKRPAGRLAWRSHFQTSLGLQTMPALLLASALFAV